MSEVFTLESVVSYGEVDRDQRMTLAGVFRLLQEAAIKHADAYGLGAKAMAAQGESWVLHRLAGEIARYPRYEERVTVRTWSTGIRGFRGHRDLRVFCGEELVVAASTLWLYLDLRTKSLTRVPAELADRLPVGSGAAFRPDFEKRRLAPPRPGVPMCEVSLRYADFDANGHLNNPAYLEALQTALSRRGGPVAPRGLEVQFLREVPPEAPAIAVALDGDAEVLRVGWGSGGELRAQGEVRF